MPYSAENTVIWLARSPWSDITWRLVLSQTQMPNFNVFGPFVISILRLCVILTHYMLLLVTPWLNIVWEALARLNANLMKQSSLILTFLLTLLVSLSMSGCSLVFGLTSVNHFVAILGIWGLENEVMLLSKCYMLIYAATWLSQLQQPFYSWGENALLFPISIVQSASVIFVKTCIRWCESSYEASRTEETNTDVATQQRRKSYEVHMVQI